MSKEDKEGYIVKFVESKGQKTDYAAKAYEVIKVNYYLVNTLIISLSALLFSQLVILFVFMFIHRPLGSYSLKST